MTEHVSNDRAPILEESVQPNWLNDIEPRFEFALLSRVLITPEITTVGDIGGSGVRKLLNILGGDFAGPKIRGRILPGGGDWPLLRPDGVGLVNARYTLETDDGVLINIINTGYRHAPQNTIRALDAKTEVVDFADYYLRTNTVFEAPVGRYDWMSRHVFVGIAERHPKVLFIKYFMLL